MNAKTVGARVSEEEKAAIVLTAKNRGFSTISGFLREVILREIRQENSH